MIRNKRILVIIGGGIAAYKILDLIRKLRQADNDVIPVLTRAGEQFVTPLSVAALAANPVSRDLFDQTAEAEIGHIAMSRRCDLILVAPATADLIAKMANGLADDLATTLLLATDIPVAVAPAMNVRMWEHRATQRNLRVLADDGVHLVGPVAGEMACGEYGLGRMAEPDAIVQSLGRMLSVDNTASSIRAIVTSGSTREPIDPVRYIANKSSGKQGAAIAQAFVGRGAEVVFITGPSANEPPVGTEVVHVESAREMLSAVQDALPADVIVCAAAVADWRVANASASKLKKDPDGGEIELKMVENPDILATVSGAGNRPKLVVGFAAETENLKANATAKRKRKGCDWIVANDVGPTRGIFGGNENEVCLITGDGSESWPRMPKSAVAENLVQKIHDHLQR